jgi:hypothetical protein
MVNGPPSIQAPPYKMPVLYHLWPKEDISIESLRGHYHGVSTYCWQTGLIGDCLPVDVAAGKGRFASSSGSFDLVSGFAFLVEVAAVDVVDDRDGKILHLQTSNGFNT